MIIIIATVATGQAQALYKNGIGANGIASPNAITRLVWCQISRKLDTSMKSQSISVNRAHNDHN